MRKEVCKERVARQRLGRTMKDPYRWNIRRFIVSLCLVSVFLVGGCQGKEKQRQEIRLEGIGCLEAGDYEAAIECFEKALEYSDKTVGEFQLDVLKYRAEAEYLSGDYRAAAYTYEVLSQIDEERTEYWFRLCILQALDGQTDKAWEAYQKLYQAVPESQETAQALLTLGQTLAKQGSFDKAAELYQQALDGGMQNGEIYNRMGVCQLEAGEFDSAILYLEQGIQTGDASVMESLMVNQAAAYEKKLDFKRALAILEQYTAAYGASPEIQKEIDFLKTR